MLALTKEEIDQRVPVWYAMSELYTASELQDYDFKWIAEELEKSSYPAQTLRYILEEEVAPALSGNLRFNPTPVIDGWTQEEIKTLMLNYLSRKPTLLERIIPKRILVRKRLEIIEPELSRLRSVLGEL
jgi:hypothetical protein